ncbi:integrase core domain-containing protein [Sphingomonas sp. CCH5-D11]|uniref:integrase core domain-containing protein n=1 Tax=Sphingomonas sp. CCH5-D11 TaxID=1768786 RepID=UPI0018D20CE4
MNSTPDARIVIEQLPTWLTHYNEVHPHKALGYRSPREYITQTRKAVRHFRGGQQRQLCMERRHFSVSRRRIP